MSKWPTVLSIAFPVEERDAEVDGDLHAVAGAPPHEVHAQGILVPREPEGPAVVAVAETRFRGTRCVNDLESFIPFLWLFCGRSLLYPWVNKKEMSL